MVHGTWCMVHGAWYMVHGAGYMVLGTWCISFFVFIFMSKKSKSRPPHFLHFWYFWGWGGLSWPESDSARKIIIKHGGKCTMYPAPCTMHHAPCTMHHAPSTMHHAPCTMHRCAGIFDAVLLMQASYPSRIPYEQIHGQYASQLPADVTARLGRCGPSAFSAIVAQASNGAACMVVMELLAW